MKMFGVENRHALLKAVVFFVVAIGCFYVSFAFAQDAGSGGAEGLGTVASNITSSFGNMAKLITAGAFLAGLGFAVGSVLMFKQHKDNPTQIPIGKPIAFLLVAIALLFLPSVFKMGGKTVFSSGAEAGTIAGEESI